MKRHLIVLSASALGLSVPALVAGLGSSSQARASSLRATTCGHERWAVKTLADPAARTIDFHPRPTTITALRRLRPTPSQKRAHGVERTTFRIKARLVEARIEHDEDVFLVVAAPRHHGRKMIVEMPSPRCMNHSIKKKQMRRARAAYIRACGRPSATSFNDVHGRATITGVGYFDYDHGQTGMAPNGIELHPALRFRGSCS